MGRGADLRGRAQAIAPDAPHVPNAPALRRQGLVRRRSPGGGSPEGLLQYYIDTAYPIERTGFGNEQIRAATYGDGATSSAGDLFLVNPAGPGLNMREELAQAYALSDEPQYASFLSLVPDYHPTLFDRALPERPAFPAAPSKVWPDFGVAMLRSEEFSAYWTGNRLKL